jgi:hypothetical protein
VTLLDDVLAMTSVERAQLYSSLKPAELKALDGVLSGALDNPYARWQTDPIGFVTQQIQETAWSKQREILMSVLNNKRTAVPACHAPGKSHIASRTVAWWATAFPPGTSQVITTATTFRQVRNIMWPQIRKIQQRHNLPGEVLTTEWKIEGDIAAYGFSSGDNNEAAVQGIHYPNLLIVVDEAGGLSHTLGGALEALMTGGNTRLLVIGNPPTDEEGSWFEKCCTSDLYNVIPISAYDTPNFTGEDPGQCKACPPSVAPHSVGTHLVDQTWVNDVIYEFGAESAFVEARVHARFPRSSTNKVIPLNWCERAMENDNPIDGDAIKLGVDVAADGGDEYVIAWADGWTAKITHRSSGSDNANPVDVALVLLEEIRSAEALHRKRGVTRKVQVKIDEIGVGWGVVGILKTWGDEGKHQSDIIGVKVSRKAQNEDKFVNQRAEMWWNGRELLAPEPGTGKQAIRLEVDRRTLAQLATPKYKADSSGRIQIERKDEIKRRGGHSPDRAEAVLLALYNPPSRGIAPAVMPIGVSQTNPWAGAF